MISIPRAMMSTNPRREKPECLLQGVGSIISHTTGVSLDSVPTTPRASEGDLQHVMLD